MHLRVTTTGSSALDATDEAARNLGSMCRHIADVFEQVALAAQAAEEGV